MRKTFVIIWTLQTTNRFIQVSCFISRITVKIVNRFCVNVKCFVTHGPDTVVKHFVGVENRFISVSTPREGPSVKPVQSIVAAVYRVQTFFSGKTEFSSRNGRIICGFSLPPADVEIFRSRTNVRRARFVSEHSGNPRGYRVTAGACSTCCGRIAARRRVNKLRCGRP